MYVEGISFVKVFVFVLRDSVKFINKRFELFFSSIVDILTTILNGLSPKK